MKPEIEHCPDARLAFEPLVSRSHPEERAGRHWCKNATCEWWDQGYDENCAKEDGMDNAISLCPDYVPMDGHTCERCGDFVPRDWIHGCG